MKRIYALILLAFFTTQIMAEDLSINGTVMSGNGEPVSNQAVYLSSSDSIGFIYSTVVYTNEAGLFADVVELNGDVTQGGIIASTESCDDMVTMVAYFNPGNYDLMFSFEICVDTIGGGNDTIVDGCENSFYYYQDDFEVQFFGQLDQEGDVTFSWNFGDGTTGDGMEVSHSYTEEGSYTVSLETVLNDTCEYISYQTLYIIQDSIGGNDSTNCQNDFEISVQDMTVSVYGWGVGDTEVEYYYWNFGDNSVIEGQTATYEFNSAGTYQITLTTISYDSCEAISTQFITLSETGSGDILFGNVSVENELLDVGFVHLYSINNDTVGGDDFVLFATATIDSAGTYYFINVPQGNFLILAQTSPNSIYFDNTLPTYYGNVIYWIDATIVTLGDPANPYDINLQLTTGANAGEGQINGDLVGEGFKAQLIDGDVSLYLLDENNTPLEIRYSEIDESFDFSDIAFGDYIVYAEVVGLTTEVANVSLTADNPISDVEITITPNGVTTGLDDQLSLLAINGNIYPNPVNSHAYLEIDLLETSNIQLTVINQLGQIVNSNSEFMTKGLNKIELNTQSYPSGVYFVQIRTANSTVSQKFIKK